MTPAGSNLSTCAARRPQDADLEHLLGLLLDREEEALVHLCITMSPRSLSVPQLSARAVSSPNFGLRSLQPTAVTTTRPTPHATVTNRRDLISRLPFPMPVEQRALRPQRGPRVSGPPSRPLRLQPRAAVSESGQSMPPRLARSREPSRAIQDVPKGVRRAI